MSTFARARASHAGLVFTAFVALSPVFTLGEPSAAAQETGAVRTLTLDEVLRIARERNGDIAIARERIEQSSADVDRALAPLLPTIVVQGKYTRVDQEVVLSGATLGGGGGLQKLGTELQSAVGKTGLTGVQDLYAQTGKTQPPAVQQGYADVLSLSNQITNYCVDNPNASECNSKPIVIQAADQLDFIANATVPLVVPPAYVALRGAKQMREAMMKGVDVASTQVLTQVAATFFAAAGQDELVQARVHAVEVAEKTVRDARARLEAGVVNKVEVQRAETALLRAQQTLVEAQTNAASAYRALRTLAAIDEPFRAQPVALTEGSFDISPKVVERAFDKRPEFAQLRLQADATDQNRLAANLRWLPTLSGFALFRAFNAAGFVGRNYQFSFGLQLDWLLYDGGQRDALARQMRSVHRELEVRKGQLRRQIADDVFNTRDQLATKRRGLDAAARQVDLAKSILELVRAQYGAGTATQLDLLNAQDGLVNAEVGLASVRFDVALTQLQLQRATGEFPGSL